MPVQIAWNASRSLTMSSLGRPGGGGADDDAAGEAVGFAELADDAAQPRALVARFDLARHADVIDRRHEHQKPSRHRDVRGQPRALGAERLLDDLDQDLLAFLQQVLDLRLLRARPRDVPAGGLVVVVAGLELLELLERVDDLGDVEKAVALEADVDEGGLHAGQDFRDPALVDVADDAALPLAFDEDFGDEIVFENGHHGLVAIRGDDHLLGHSRTPSRLQAWDLRLAGRCNDQPEARSPESKPNVSS